MTRNREPSIAVITGSGMTEHFKSSREETTNTEFGRATTYRCGDFYLLPRHGKGHTIPPHEINYRANMSALHGLGVRTVIATGAVGTMDQRFSVGESGLVDQFIDLTRTRARTIFENRVVHTDMTRPYSIQVNDAILRASEKVGVRLRSGLTYVCVEGPRFETAAEIQAFRSMGGDVVGMTGVPEVVFAGEMGMRYSSLVTATNWAAGIGEKVSHQEVLGVIEKTGPRVKRIVEETVKLLA